MARPSLNSPSGADSVSLCQTSHQIEDVAPCARRLTKHPLAVFIASGTSSPCAPGLRFHLHIKEPPEEVARHRPILPSQSQSATSTAATRILAASKMADQFIGLQMLVTLRDPPARLKGTVSAVEAGSTLTLSNGTKIDYTPRRGSLFCGHTWFCSGCSITTLPVVIKDVNGANRRYSYSLAVGRE